MTTIYETQKEVLLIVRKLEVVRGMLATTQTEGGSLLATLVREAVLRREIKKLVSKRDKNRRIVKQIVSQKYTSFSCQNDSNNSNSCTSKESRV